MNYEQALKNARECIGPYCKACALCDGRACGNQMPGPGAKGVGDTARRNYEAWQAVRVQMDTICENKAPDTSVTLFGRRFAYPFFAGPVGAVQLHYGDKYDDLTYNNILVSACAKKGIAAFTGDGPYADVMTVACQAISRVGGCGVPTVKPWGAEVLADKMALINDSGAFAVAMDIDAAGLPFLQDMKPPAGSKTVEELSQVMALTNKPFIIKGIMTVRGAVKAKRAGAAGIVVSNHGGRVLDQCPATAEVLPAIVTAVGQDMTILVDGGLRSGVDVFKALAMGADGVLITRPFVPAVYGGGEEGVTAYIDKIGTELADTMRMCGTHSIAEIGSEQIWRG